jgi:hypothetical protein
VSLVVVCGVSGVAHEATVAKATIINIASFFMTNVLMVNQNGLLLFTQKICLDFCAFFSTFERVVLKGLCVNIIRDFSGLIVVINATIICKSMSFIYLVYPPQNR